jgi:tetratricopeptide (TPR) repeat protein
MATQSFSPKGKPSRSLLSTVSSIVVLALVFAVFPALSEDADAQATRGVGRVRGKVTGPDGEPLEGVQVVLTQTETGTTYEIFTDENGNWIKGNLGSGNYNIDFFAEGFVPQGVATQVTQAGRPPVIETTMEAGEAPPAEEGRETPFGRALREGNELYQAEDFEGALAAFEQALVDFADNENVYFARLNAGNAALELERYDLAREHYGAVLSTDMMNVDAMLGVAESYLLERRIDEAMESLSLLDPTAIEDPVVFYNVAVLLYDEGQPAESIGYFELALERDPEFVDAHMQVAVAKLRTGDNEGARAHLEKVIELDPDSQRAAEAQSFLEIIGV